MGGSNHSRCFSATPCCWFSELPDVWHCLGLLRSGTTEANQRALRTVLLAFHASVSPHSQGNVVWHHSCKEHLPQAKKTTHPFPSSCLAILRLIVPKIYLLRTPASPTKYRRSSQKRFSVVKERPAQDLSILHGRCCQESISPCRRGLLAWALCLLVS